MTDVTLKYDEQINRRLWLTGGGYAVLGAMIKIGCGRAYSLSSTLEPRRDYDRIFYDVDAPATNFPLFETDFYPPDGYEGVFFCPHDLTPGPFGTFGFGTGSSDDRVFSMHKGRIVPNSAHGSANVSQRQRPRLRKSIFREEWSFTASHKFRSGSPTPDFSYWLMATHLSEQDTSGTLGLLQVLDLSPMAAEYLKQLPSYLQLARQVGGLSEDYSPFYEQELDPKSNRWRGVVNARIKTGWLSSETRTFYLD